MQRAWRRRWEKNKKYRQELLKKAAVPLVATGIIFSVMASVTYANPTGGNITTGQGSISVNGSEMTIQQQTDKMGINWDSFNIGSGEKVKFIQPGSQSVALNRVLGSDASKIYGTLEANGKVFLINPNGVLFAQGANVNVGGLVATSSNISDADFIAGNYAFKGGQGGSVINGGSITAAGGNVELLGSIVSNQGVITATGITTDGSSGTVRLVGNSVTLGAGSSINADSKAILRAGADGTGVGTVTVAAGTVTAPKTDIYYNPVSYTDSKTRSNTVSNPYKNLLAGTDVTAYMLVNTATDLQNVNNNIYGIYALNNDLNMAGIDFVPIGSAEWFSGVFNGDSHTIKNLTIDSSAKNVGLFARVNNSSIYDLTLKNVDVTATGGGQNTYAGALVGWSNNSTISNVTVSGQVEGNVEYIGGIAGRSQNGTIVNAVNSADVNIFDNSGRLRHAAGVVGKNDGGLVSNSVNKGAVTNNNSEGYVGGLVAFNYNGATVQDSENRGVVTGGSASYVGGLVGANWGDTVLQGGKIVNSVNRAAVEGGSESNIGGIAGGMKNSSVVNVINRGDISGGGNWVGGLVGVDYGNSLVDTGRNYGSVSANDDKSDVGGLIGNQRNSTLVNSENYGVIIGSANGNTGGLVGYQLGGELYDSKNHGNVIGGINSNTGGLIGYQVNGLVSHSENDAKVTDTQGSSPASNDRKVRLDSNYELTNEWYLWAVHSGKTQEIKNNVGGIVGKSVNSSVEHTANEGKVIASNTFSNAGGIVGWSDAAVIVDASNSAGLITAADHSNVGGIAGYAGNGSIIQTVVNAGTIGQATNSAGGQNQSNIGGIVGWNSASSIDDARNNANIHGSNAWHIAGIAGNNTEEYRAGLVNTASISNSVNNGKVTGFANNSYVAGIVGANSNGTIVTTKNTGAIANYGNESYVAGIAGTNWQGSLIDQSVNQGSVTATGVSASAGGIAGGNGSDGGANTYILPSIVSNSVNEGVVSGGIGSYSKTGGILGFNNGGVVENCLNTGNIIHQSGFAGALIGRSSNAPGEIVNSYFALTTANGLNAAGGTSISTMSSAGLSIAQLADVNTFTNWDFNNIWTMNAAPALRGTLSL